MLNFKMYFSFNGSFCKTYDQFREINDPLFNNKTDDEIH